MKGPSRRREAIQTILNSLNMYEVFDPRTPTPKGVHLMGPKLGIKSWNGVGRDEICNHWLCSFIHDILKM